MNERIRKLVDKAIGDVDYIRDDDFTNEELSKMYIPDCFAEKFAELIVGECRDMFVVSSPSWNLLNEKLEHLGVEE
jgi:hypothetical protein